MGSLHLTFFHRNLKAGYSINKVVHTIVSTFENKEEYYVPCVKTSGTLWNLWFVYRHRNKQGINHLTGGSNYCVMSLIGCKSILTIHDTVFMDFNASSRLMRLSITVTAAALSLILSAKSSVSRMQRSLPQHPRASDLLFPSTTLRSLSKNLSITEKLPTVLSSE